MYFCNPVPKIHQYRVQVLFRRFLHIQEELVELKRAVRVVKGIRFDPFEELLRVHFFLPNLKEVLYSIEGLMVIHHKLVLLPLILWEARQTVEGIVRFELSFFFLVKFWRFLLKRLCFEYHLALLTEVLTRNPKKTFSEDVLLFL